MKDILIIGYGVVGRTIHNAISEKCLSSDLSLDVCIYDPYLEKFGMNTELDYQKFDETYSSIFLCVPTSQDEDIDAKYNPSIIIDYLDTLVGIEYSGFVFIKSTVLFDDIESYKNKLKIVYWAEFLNDLTAEEDFLKDTIPLMGCEAFLKNDIRGYILKFFPHITDIHFEGLKEAIHFKYIRNLYIAWKISFWNMIASNHLMDQRLIRQLMEKYPLEEMMEISSDGLLGFGGKCLPKDAEAFNDAVLKEPMLENMIRRNYQARKNSLAILKRGN